MKGKFLGAYMDADLVSRIEHQIRDRQEKKLPRLSRATLIRQAIKKTYDKPAEALA